MHLFSRLVCCGPGAEGNVHYSDDDSSGDEFTGGGAASAAVIRWPHDTPRRLEDAGSVRVLPSDVKATAERSRHPGHRKSESVANFVPHQQQRPGGAGAKAGEAGGRWPGKQSSLRSLDSPKRRDRKDYKVGDLIDESCDKSVLDLAGRETRRLPDVAGEDKVAWAAEVLRIDLTETGIRT
ncbi:unnamed protein product [Ectocarpus sp. 12 AP-2014]